METKRTFTLRTKKQKTKRDIGTLLEHINEEKGIGEFVTRRIYWKQMGLREVAVKESKETIIT